MAAKGTARIAGEKARALAERLGGYLYVDCELVRENDATLLRVLIDDEGGLSLERCEAFHRILADEVDDLDFDYLEVSSPGLDRPLKTDADLARALHKAVELKLYKAQDGVKTFTGTLAAFDADSVTLESAQGAATFLRKDVAKLCFVIEMPGE